jgi:hypothetical protein
MMVLQAMDQLLEAALAEEREPQYWVINQEDWLEIGAKFRAGTLDNPDAIGATTYMGVPIHFAAMKARSVGLVDTAGAKMEQAI